MPVRASTTLSCSAAEVDRGRFLVAWGSVPGAGAAGGASCTGGAAFGPVAMTVPGAGKNGTGAGGPCSGDGDSPDEESATWRA